TASRIAQVEPLPFVPVTVMTGHARRASILEWPRATRPSPTATALGGSARGEASQPSSVFGRIKSASARRRRLPRQVRKQARELVFELAAIDDHVDRPLVNQEFRALETLGELFADRLLDDARTREADQRSRLGDHEVGDE